MEIHAKAGIASGLARQNPKLIADKSLAIQMHKEGFHLGIIAAKTGRDRGEIRRFLIQAGCYKPEQRGHWHKGINPVVAIVRHYQSEIKILSRLDENKHWCKPPIAAWRKKFARAEYHKGYGKAWRKLNHARANSYARKSNKKRMKTNPAYRAVVNLRHRLKQLIKGKIGIVSNELVGCTHHQLKSHIAQQFTDGMTWGNYGTWHIDHKRPCASFDLTIRSEQLACFHFSNLQPLWAAENMRKGDKW